MNRKGFIAWIGLVVIVSGVGIDQVAESYLVNSFRGGLALLSNNDGALMLAGLKYLLIYKPAIVALSALVISMLSVSVPLLIRKIDFKGARIVVLASALASPLLSLATTLVRGVLSA
jgi:hypothetical protein